MVSTGVTEKYRLTSVMDLAPCVYGSLSNFCSDIPNGCSYNTHAASYYFYVFWDLV